MVRTGLEIRYSIPQNDTKYYWMDDVSTILFISDIHGNLPALEAVLKHAGKFDALVCAGDTVGYGPFPNECVERIRELGAVTIAGNHDLAATGMLDTEDFNEFAQISCEWTQKQLSRTTAEYLLSLPYALEIDAGVARDEGTSGDTEDLSDDMLLVHGSPLDPISDYVLSGRHAVDVFGVMTHDICVIGHSHYPAVFILEPPGLVVGEHVEDKREIKLEEEHRYIVNVGSVGQPRDDDPRACYFTYCPEKKVFTCHRVEYPIEETQEKMREAGLPEPLIDRLSDGW